MADADLVVFAVPVLAMAAACLAGCAGTTPAGSMAEAGSVGLSSKPIAQFSSCAKPLYPAESLARRTQGTTTLRFLIDTDGSVADAAVSESSGDPLLDEAARVAIAKCRFTPGIAAGKPVRSWVPVQYVWSLS